MENIFDGYFYNPTKGNLTLDEVIRELFSYAAEKPDLSYEIIVGCDSPSEEEPHFPLVLLILRKGQGGRFFIKKVSYPLGEKKFYNWKQRILEEVMLSCQFALGLREKLGKEVRYIHADVGERGQTRDMVKEVVGLIRGSGFEPKIKPESFVASVVADRFT